jgi:hypothetical protein
VISCIHLKEQTKDILKLKSVSNTTIRDVAKHLTFGGGGGCWRIIRVIIIIKLFVIDWHSRTKFSEKRGVWVVLPQKFFTFLKL